MSEEIQDVECSICGRNGLPPVSCGICKGEAETQPRNYTLSEERSGRAPAVERYGETGDTAPKKTDPLWAGTQ